MHVIDPDREIQKKARQPLVLLMLAGVLLFSLWQLGAVVNWVIGLCGLGVAFVLPTILRLPNIALTRLSGALGLMVLAFALPEDRGRVVTGAIFHAVCGLVAAYLWMATRVKRRSNEAMLSPSGPSRISDNLDSLAAVSAIALATIYLFLHYDSGAIDQRPTWLFALGPAVIASVAFIRAVQRAVLLWRAKDRVFADLLGREFWVLTWFVVVTCTLIVAQLRSWIDESLIGFIWLPASIIGIWGLSASVSAYDRQLGVSRVTTSGPLELDVQVRVLMTAFITGSALFFAGWLTPTEWWTNELSRAALLVMALIVSAVVYVIVRNGIGILAARDRDALALSLRRLSESSLAVHTLSELAEAVLSILNKTTNVDARIYVRERNVVLRTDRSGAAMVLNDSRPGDRASRERVGHAASACQVLPDSLLQLLESRGRALRTLDLVDRRVKETSVREAYAWLVAENISVAVPIYDGSSLTAVLSFSGYRGAFGFKELALFDRLAAHIAAGLSSVLRSDLLRSELAHRRRELELLRDEVDVLKDDALTWRNKQRVVNGGRRFRVGTGWPSSAMREVRTKVISASNAHSHILLVQPFGGDTEGMIELAHDNRSPQAPLLYFDCAEPTVVKQPYERDVGLASERSAQIEEYLFGASNCPEQGLLSLASGGTLVLKNIAALPKLVQERLAAALSEGIVHGEKGAHVIRVRLVATSTPKGISCLASELSAVLQVQIQVPALSERSDDIPLLALNAAAYFGGLNPPVFSELALSLLRAYHWPGDVLELDSVICQAASMSAERTDSTQDAFLDILLEIIGRRLPDVALRGPLLKELMVYFEGVPEKLCEKLGLDLAKLNELLAEDFRQARAHQ